MASGTLGVPQLLPADTLVTLYKVPTDVVCTLNFNLVNTSSEPVLVRVAISATPTPLRGEYVEYDTYLLPAGMPENGNVLERSAFVVEAGKYVVASANVADAVACRVHGEEN